MLNSPHTVRKESRGRIPQCEGQSQIHSHLEGIITRLFLTCKQHRKQSGKCLPTSVVNYPRKTLREARGVDNEIFTIYNLAEKTLVLELKPYLKHMKQDTRSIFNSVFPS